MKMNTDLTHLKAYAHTQLHERQIPEVEFISGAVAQILSVIETHQTLRAVGAGQRREETGGLTFIALPLIIRQQLKCLALSFSDALQTQVLGF